MIKKFVAGAFIICILGTSTTMSYANNINTINIASNEIRAVELQRNFFEILEPKRNTVTTDKNILLSFRASEGTKVNIEVYNNISKEKDILLYDPIEITVGAFQKGWASIDLEPGLNKIYFTIKYKNGSGDSRSRTINVMELQEVKQLLQDVVNKSILGIGKKL